MVVERIVAGARDRRSGEGNRGVGGKESGRSDDGRGECARTGGTVPICIRTCTRDADENLKRARLGTRPAAICRTR